MNCGSTAAYPANECISISGNYYNLGCKSSDTASFSSNTYVDSQCTQAIGSGQTSPLSQSNCKNGVQNTCGGQNQPPDPNQPSESGSETGPCSQDDNSPTSAGNDDDASPSPGARPGASSPGECGLETAKKAITDECSCGTSPCAKGKYCWVSPWAVCQDTAYPCGAEEQFCGNIGTLKMYKEDFKGCSDPTTCPKPPADDKRTKCAIMIAGNSEPGKCMAVCSVGYTKESQELLKTMNSCTDDEKKEWDETAEKNEAAYEASLSSGSAVAPTFAVAMTAAIVVFAALY